MAERVVFLSIPQLRQRDVTPGALASLEALVGRGGMAEYCPGFPSLAAPAFAALVTGGTPSEHGMVGDAYFDRQARRVVARPFPDEAIAGPKLWDRLRAARPGARSLIWFEPNLRGAAVDLAAWVEPVGGLATEPAELASTLTDRFGPYLAPRVDPEGEPLRLAATAWILKSAAAMIAEQGPDLSLIRVPYLGQVARRFGADGREAGRSVVELESVLRPFLQSLPADTTILAATESVSTPVTGPVYPNLVLRGLGLLRVVDAPGGGTDIDVETSAAFALADHQICHIYLNDPEAAAPVAAAFSGAHDDGIATVATAARRARLGLDHERAGDLVLVCEPNRWFAPDWWVLRREIPGDPATGSGLAYGSGIAPEHVQGSLGAPPPSAEYHGVVVCSRPDLLDEGAGELSARDLHDLLVRALGLEAG